jgi:hypothetical protein
MFARNVRLDEDGQDPAPIKVGTTFIPIMALRVRGCDRIANIRGRLPRLVQNSAAFQTLLHRVVFFRPAAELGRTQPPSFVAATAELASIADASKASRGPRRSASP